MDDPFAFRPYDPSCGVSPFDWILLEASRIRLLRQKHNAAIVRTQRDMDMAWRRPLWKMLDEQMTDSSEDRRTTDRGKRVKSPL